MSWFSPQLIDVVHSGVPMTADKLVVFVCFMNSRILTFIFPIIKKWIGDCRESTFVFLYSSSKMMCFKLFFDLHYYLDCVIISVCLLIAYKGGSMAERLGHRLLLSKNLKMLFTLPVSSYY